MTMHSSTSYLGGSGASSSIPIGSGFSAIVPGGGFSYHKYLLPGIIGMVILFSSLLSALGTVQDREFGSMRMLMISPVLQRS